jgi:myo-inositol-1(or 4)-monophosphatase
MVQKKKASSTGTKVIARKSATKAAVQKAPVKKAPAKKAPVKKVPVSKAAAKKDVKAKVPVKAKPVTAVKEKAAQKKPAPKTPVKAKAVAKSKSMIAPQKAPAKKATVKKVAAKPQPAPKVEQEIRPAASLKTKSPKKVVEEKTAPQELQSGGSRRQSGANLKFLVSVAQAVKDAVAPLALAVKGREVVDEAPSGDITFLLDRVAEKALFNHLKAAALPVAYYSEHEGYSTFSSKAPKSLLIVDPIDGTRAAKSGFEGCVVAVASTRVIERPTIADIDCACVMDLLGERIFLAERGKGARVYVDGRLKRPKLSDNTDLESMIWSMTIPARPAELIFPTAARIIDLSSLKGGFFACNSTSFSLTRLVTNQLDACIDIANRYYRDIPDRVEDYFINAGRGKVIGVAPYDIAASLLIAQEAGCTVTDAYGKGFEDLLLLDSSKGNHQSIVAASNAQLHEKLLSFFDTRIRQYEQLLTRHTGGE